MGQCRQTCCPNLIGLHQLSRLKISSDQKTQLA